MAMPKEIIFHGSLTAEDVIKAKKALLDSFLAKYPKEDQDNILRILFERGVIEAEQA